VLRGTGTGDFAPGTFYYFDPAWSRDGRLLAVTVEEATESHGYDDVVVFRQGKRWLTLPGGESSISGSPSWAPDGKRLVLVGYQSSSGGGLYIRGVGSKVSVDLTNEWANADDTPAWSPDGSRIAFTRSNEGQTRLYLIGPNGHNLTQLARISAKNPSWSPDGKRLVFDDGHRIAVINADGTGLHYLTHGSRVDTEPAWSLDGRTIAFARSRSASSQASDIWLMTPTGAKQRLFVKNGSQPAWKGSPW
jgi:TolB protein